MALTPYQQLEQEFRRLHAFRSAASILRWDSAVMMPRGSSDLRGEQLAALETESHSLLTSPRVSRLLARAEANSAGLEDWQSANVREMRREREHAIATPHNLVSRLAKATARAEMKWIEAKQKSDFAIFAPHLEEVINLLRDKAGLLGKALNLDPYDALVDEFSPGMTSAEIDAIFTTLGRRLPGLIQEVIELQARRPPLEITGRYTAAKQRQLALEVMKVLGFPFDRGRLDESEHPFTGGVPGDIRITTRFSATDPLSGLMGVLHETGHAMYDVGLPEAWRGQPVGRDRGMALQESQSLLLEMLIGRNRPFLRYMKPLLDKVFSVSGPEWEVENVYRLLIRVRRSLIRVDADEVTYPVHIMLRYELENEILRGELKVRDLPEAWNSRIQDRLGVRPANDAEGCLQDVHWAVGSFGYFPSYAMGAVIAGQLYESLRAERPELDDEIAAGQFSGLFDWLRQNVHAVAATVSMPELIRNATGKPLSAAAWLRYIEGKYLEE
ncbi:MAG TPA: carboxypeptidase M32 [Steroidobacteraceae bacterium]|jgi:Zn-dependent carboxypeptidase|nr:carboxypeptidase M32 [Steroidobacteraceae bacterium]